MKDKNVRIWVLLVACLFVLAHFPVESQESSVEGGRKVERFVAKETRIIHFSGYDWRVKSSKRRVGPGSNYFSDQTENVWLDNQGRLHLRITERDGHWQCAEVVSQESFGFGAYRFYLGTPMVRIDPNVTLGLFTWSDAREYAHREIDIECSKWGKADDTNNAQFVVQPYQPVGHLLRFRIPPEMEATTQIFDWHSNRVDFRSLAGHAREAGSQNLSIKDWSFTKRGVPQPADENARINLWLATPSPRNSNDTEVIISKFEFQPPENQAPQISFASLPPASLQPGPEGTGKISGSARSAKLSECSVVIYAYGDKWYVQPIAAAPKTKIMAGKWSATTHGGTEYAALLVIGSYEPPAAMADLPEVGGDVLAVVRQKPK